MPESQNEFLHLGCQSGRAFVEASAFPSCGKCCSVSYGNPGARLPDQQTVLSRSCTIIYSASLLCGVASLRTNPRQECIPSRLLLLTWWPPSPTETCICLIPAAIGDATVAPLSSAHYIPILASPPYLLFSFHYVALNPVFLRRHYLLSQLPNRFIRLSPHQHSPCNYFVLVCILFT